MHSVAVGQVYSAFRTQVAILAYADVFYYCAIIAFFVVPFCFLLSPKTGGGWTTTVLHSFPATLEAIAVASGYTNSAVATATYAINIVPPSSPSATAAISPFRSPAAPLPATRRARIRARAARGGQRRIL